MFSMRKCLTSAGLALVIAASPASVAFLSMPAAASEIKVIVNRVPITSYDIQRRAAFMKLQRRKGDLNSLAEEEMIDQALRMAEAQRLRIQITDEQVDARLQQLRQVEQDAGQAARRHHGPERRDQAALQGIHPLADGLEPGGQHARTQQRRHHVRAGRRCGACCSRAAPSRPRRNTCSSRSSSWCRRASAATWRSASARRKPCARASTDATIPASSPRACST